MNDLNNTIARLELAQIGWVIPDIYAAVQSWQTPWASLAFRFPQPASLKALTRIQ